MENSDEDLFNAAKNGNLGEVNKLLDKGVDPNKTIFNGETLLYIASQYNNLEVVEALLEKGADVDQATNNGETPLYIASQEGHSELVETLLKKGADPNKARTDTRETPIQVATRPGLADFMGDYQRKEKTLQGVQGITEVVGNDYDAYLPKDLYEYIGKKDRNDNYVAGRRRKTKKSKKSKKSRKSKKR